MGTMTRTRSATVAVALVAAALAARPGVALAERARATLADSEIELSEPISFETGGAVIRQESLPLLDRVVAVLRGSPGVTIEVQAHSDSRGMDSWNLRLTAARAEAIRAYLVAHGIAPARIEARGYGETCPIDTNSTAAGRARNRRVVLLRTDHPVARQCPIPPPPPPEPPPPPPEEQIEDDQYQQ